VRIGGVLTVVAMVAFIVVSVRRERSHDAVDPGGPAPHHVADGM
jgi:hypothetical protein